jgi:hypothetical protein
VSRLLVLVALLVLLAAALGGPTLLAGAQDIPRRVAHAVKSEPSDSQSAAQISLAEFEAVPHGTVVERARELLGEPEHLSRAGVEGVEIECWTYGVAGATGAFQLCFADGRLSSRFRYS